MVLTVTQILGPMDAVAIAEAASAAVLTNATEDDVVDAASIFWLM